MADAWNNPLFKTVFNGLVISSAGSIFFLLNPQWLDISDFGVWICNSFIEPRIGLCICFPLARSSRRGAGEGSALPVLLDFDLPALVIFKPDRCICSSVHNKTSSRQCLRQPCEGDIISLQGGFSRLLPVCPVSCWRRGRDFLFYWCFCFAGKKIRKEICQILGTVERHN